MVHRTQHILNNNQTNRHQSRQEIKVFAAFVRPVVNIKQQSRGYQSSGPTSPLIFPNLRDDPQIDQRNREYFGPNDRDRSLQIGGFRFDFA